MKALEATYSTVLLAEPRPGVVQLTLNRPARGNAQTPAMFDELEEVARTLDAEPGLRVVVITGAGRIFCAGYDLAEAEKLPALGALGMLDQQERAARAMSAVRDIRVPVIAAVNGAASGGGLALALTADIRLAAPVAKFNVAFVKIGLSAGDLGVSWLLPRLIGPGRAAEMCFTGRMVAADEAERLGLVNRICPAESLVDEALALAGQIVPNSPGGVWLSKRALQGNLETGSYAAALEMENRGQSLLTRTADMAEAMAALNARRAAEFVGN